MASEANLEESKKCLLFSREAYDKRDRVTALKYAEKADRLYSSSETAKWLSKLLASPDTSSGTSQNQTGAQADKPEQKPVRNLYSEEQEEQVKEFLKINLSDYYGVLGVKRDADAEELKRSYKKQALKFHPDKNLAPGADEAFKAIGTAFATLSNPEKRRSYDMVGSTSSVNSNTSNMFNQGDVPMEDLFNMFFQAFNDEQNINSLFNQPMFVYRQGSGQFPFGNQFPFNNNVRRRRTFVQQERGRTEEDEAQDLFVQRIIQLIPLFFIFLLTFLSKLIFGSDE